MKLFGYVLAGLFLSLLPTTAFAATGLSMPGAELSLLWTLPFVGMLLSIAFAPLIVPRFWHDHFGKVAIFWCLAFVIPCLIVYGAATALYHIWQIMIEKYFPYTVLLLALFVVAGGVRVTGTLVGTPIVTTGIILFGTLIASWIGTTGAAMLLIRPLLRAIAHRKYRVHSVIFFIFLVCNIGGTLTPLGDPPLFIGFLYGIDFFWPTVNLFPSMAFMVAILIPMYFLIDTYYFNKEGRPEPPAEATAQLGEKLGLEGKANLLLLPGILGAVLMSGTFELRTFTIYHVDLQPTSLLRDAILVGLVFLSLKITSPENRRLNEFDWYPIQEVAKVFLGIFITMVPTLLILQAGTEGALAFLIASVTDQYGQPINFAYFWITGFLSCWLDNVPTYMVYFFVAGADPIQLMGELSNTLVALSMGTVFFGAMTYIANAPNLMVRAIAEGQGVPMPSFFGFFFRAVLILWPIFLVYSFIFFW